MGSNDIVDAATDGKVEELKALLEAGGSPDDMGTGVNSPLIEAAMNSHPECVALLLEKGAKIDHVDPEGKTALMWGAMRGCIKSCELLIKAGAVIDAKHEGGETALMIATQYDQDEIVKLLLTSGANPDATDDEGRTALQQVADMPRPPRRASFALINQGGLNLDLATTGESMTALMTAAKNGDMDLVVALIEKGANVNAVDAHSKTALDYAKEGGSEAIIELLKSKSEPASNADAREEEASGDNKGAASSAEGTSGSAVDADVPAPAGYSGDAKAVASTRAKEESQQKEDSKQLVMAEQPKSSTTCALL